jgi:O-antigen ligase
MSRAQQAGFDARWGGVLLFVLIVPMEYFRYFLLASYTEQISWFYLYLVYLITAGVLVVAYIAGRAGRGDMFRYVLWGFLAYTFAFPIVWYLAGSDLSDALRVEILDYYVRVAILNLLHFLAGWFLFDIARWRAIIAVLFTGAMVLTLGNVDVGAWRLRAGGVIEELGFYIVLGDALALFSFFTVAVLKQPVARLAVMLSTAIVLLLLGSRTSFFVYAATLLASLVLLDWGRRAWLHWVSIAAIALMGLAFFGSGIVAMVTSIDFEEFRVLRLLFTDEDTSLNSRQLLLIEGLRVIVNNPLFGEFASDYRVFGESGWYIHNYLEVWRQFGLLPFAAIVYLVTLCWREYLVRIRRLATAESAFVGLALLFLTMEIVSARSYGYPQIFLVIGMVARYRSLFQEWSAASRAAVARGGLAMPGRAVVSKP